MIPWYAGIEAGIFVTKKRRLAGWGARNMERVVATRRVGFSSFSRRITNVQIGDAE